MFAYSDLAFVSVFVATVVTMVAAGVETKTEIVNEATREVSFREGFLAVTNIIFAYRKLFIIDARYSRVIILKPKSPRKLIAKYYSCSRGILRLHVGNRRPSHF